MPEAIESETKMDVSTPKRLLVEDYSKYWTNKQSAAKFQSKIVTELYKALDTSLLKDLDLSGYLESYLWPNYNDKSTQEHLFSILALVNEKSRQGVPVWQCFKGDQNKFNSFFLSVLSLGYQLGDLTITERIIYVSFLQIAFQSLEEELINENVLRLVSLPMWANVNETARNNALISNSRLMKQWRHFETSMDKSGKEKVQKPKKQKMGTGKASSVEGSDTDEFYNEKNFMWFVLSHFKDVLASVDGNSSGLEILFCEKSVEWIKDLLAQLPTRRYLRLLLQASFFLPTVRLCKLMNHERGRLFQVMTEQLYSYYHFDIDDFTGTSLTRDEIVERHYERIQSLQVIAYKFFSPTLRPFSLRNVGSIEERRSLQSNLSLLTPEDLHRLAHRLSLIDEGQKLEPAVLLEAILLMHEKRSSKQEKISKTPIYPNEDVMWQSEITSEARCLGIHCTALPKLNLQFLSFYDYLQRNFSLYQLETTRAIRNDIEDVIKRITPRLSDDRSRTLFLGWARMSSPIDKFQIEKVLKPNLGESVPSLVTASVTIRMVSMRPEIKQEWLQIKENEILFLVKIRSSLMRQESPDLTRPFPEAFGVEAIRGCQVQQILDSKGKIVGREITDEEKAEKRKKKREKLQNYHWQRFREKIPEEDVTLEKRTFCVSLDATQYYMDLRNDRDDIYEDSDDSFNILIRRNSKENNFKGILETIRSLMREDSFIVPEWFQNVFLGYGDPEESSAKPIQGCIQWKDTFLDFDHLCDSFPHFDVQLDNPESLPVQRPFNASIEGNVMLVKPVEARDTSNSLLASRALPKLNQIRFTPAQTRAIYSGMGEGLTTIVGPPGTGKTDVAVQLLHLLYHNHPEQRTLIVTRSNQALNQLFEKLMGLEIDECHLLRLGHNENDESSTSSFKYNQVGRIDFILARRLELLKKVESLAVSLSCLPDVAYSCETAEMFFKNIITSNWQRFINACLDDTSIDAIQVHFPFTEFFASSNPNLFSKTSRNEDMQKAEECYNFIESLFSELEEFRPFELLRTVHEKTNYLLIKQAKIIAMTCTQAALRHVELVKLGFFVDNFVMEESAQVKDIESLIPILSRKQNTIRENETLKRVILLGDNEQLPPCVHHLTLKSYSRFDQSLFTRFVRLGVPIIRLDQQGRSRKSLANLYKWKYDFLSDLPLVSSDSRFSIANAGFKYDYQFINVPEYNGRGEQAPLPNFYQNLGEAEFLVAVYQYMRLVGYPASSISIITSYNGQKQLIRDVVRQRCGNNFFGFPHKITTVDKFQGQQSDYVLFSMVRTKEIGHVRDVRRLIVAMSRARLGLYVFGRASLFSECRETKPVFSVLLDRPTTLHIVPNERFPTNRTIGDDIKAVVVAGIEQMVEIVKNKATHLRLLPSASQ